jgi:hypothetical protein
LLTAQRTITRERIHHGVAQQLTVAALRLGLALEGVEGAGDPVAALTALQDARDALQRLLADLEGPVSPAVLKLAESLVTGSELAVSEPMTPMSAEQAATHLVSLEPGAASASTAA